MQYFEIVIQQIGMFLLYAVIGIIMVKTKIVSEHGLNYFSKFITRIALPLLIFTNTIHGATRQDFIDTLPLLGVTVVFYLLLFFLCWGLASLFRLHGDRKRVYTACSMFGNIGFMGIPVTQALFPEHGMLYIAVFTVVDQLVLWTVGVYLTRPMDPENKQESEPLGRRIGNTAKKMVNPANVGILLAVVFVLFGWHLPHVLDESLTRVGAIASPLAMIYIGGLFCFMDLRPFFKKYEIYVEVLVKMVVFPVLFTLLLRRIPFLSDEIAVTMGVLAAMPTMTTITMLAQTQESDGTYAGGMTFLTTLCSIVTLPTVCLILGR